MLDTYVVLSIYAAALLYLGGNLPGPAWMRSRTTPELPGGLRLGVRIGTAVGIAVLGLGLTTTHDGGGEMDVAEEVGGDPLDTSAPLLMGVAAVSIFAQL